MISWQDMVRFIRTISRLELGSGHRQYIRDFCKRKVPWEPLIHLAEAEGVDGLLYHHLNRFDAIHMPQPERERLTVRWDTHRKNREAIAREAASISETLERAGLSALALQGMSLLTIYAAAGLRPMGDIDLLIKPDQYPHVVAALRRIGFRIPHPAYPKNLRKGLLWLDLHTHFINLDRIQSRRYVFPKDLSGLWTRAHPLFSSSGGLLTPDPMDNFVLLSAHALKHGYSRMIWLVDLLESLKVLVSSPGGWEKLLERIHVWGQEKIVLYGLMILEGMLGLDLPEPAIRALQVKKPGSIEKYLLRLRIRGVVLPEYYVLLCLFAIKGIRKKTTFLYESMFPAEAVMAQIYLTSPSRSRFHQAVTRMARTLPSLGNGLKQAWLHGPLK